MRRILQETNVVVILLLVLCNFCIDMLRPYDLISPINAAFYMIEVTLFLFVDTLKVKSRLFVLLIYFCIFNLFIFMEILLVIGTTVLFYLNTKR